jgi:hypothetical protein
MSVLTGFNSPGPGATLGPVWTWPTDEDPAGWVRGPILHPGTTRSY